MVDNVSNTKKKEGNKRDKYWNRNINNDNYNYNYNYNYNCSSNRISNDNTRMSKHASKNYNHTTTHNYYDNNNNNTSKLPGYDNTERFDDNNYKYMKQLQRFSKSR